MAGCGAALAKICLFIVNFAVWIASLGLLAIGIWMLVQSAHFDEILAKENMTPVAVTFIVLGALCCIVGFSGCCGAFGESVCFLRLYFVVMLLIIAGEVTVCILVVINSNKVEDSMTKGMTSTIQDYYGEKTAATESVDFVQKTFVCCGARNYTDYTGSVFQKNASRVNALPDSCCAGDAKPDTCSYTSKGLKNHGCVKKTAETIKQNALLVGLVCLGFVIVQVLAMVISCCLISAVAGSNKYERV